MRGIANLNQRLALGLIGLICAAGGCGSQETRDPAKVLADTQSSPAKHKAAMVMLESQGDQAQTVRALKHLLSADGYVLATRVMAYDRLREIDPDALRQLLEIRLPRTERMQWRNWLCERIAEDEWLAMTPTLIRAWARPLAGWNDNSGERPERKALVRMYGEDGIPKVLLQVMLDSNPVTASWPSET